MLNGAPMTSSRMPNTVESLHFPLFLWHLLGGDHFRFLRITTPMTSHKKECTMIELKIYLNLNRPLLLSADYIETMARKEDSYDISAYYWLYFDIV